MSSDKLWIPLLLAIVGYLYTSVSAAYMDRRKMRLQYLSDQLQVLYGPLFSLSHASRQAKDALKQSLHTRARPRDERQPFEEADLAKWRLWMRTVFQPINLQMEQAIIHNAHLIVGNDMPREFQQFLAHVESYKALLQEWEAGDFTNQTATVPFPPGLDDYLQSTFLELSRHQGDLLQSFSRRTNHP